MTLRLGENNHDSDNIWQFSAHGSTHWTRFVACVFEEMEQQAIEAQTRVPRRLALHNKEIPVPFDAPVHLYSSVACSMQVQTRVRLSGSQKSINNIKELIWSTCANEVDPGEQGLRAGAASGWP